MYHFLGVQIAPYFVLMLNDTIALEHERVEFKVLLSLKIRLLHGMISIC